jgi:Cu-processing system ATP-binding protein
MPQISRFPDNLSVDELFAMLRDLRGGERDLDIELFARYDLGGEIGRKRLGTLSGGTRQKINAAIAFMFSPRVLLLDEPTVGLDPVSTAIFKDKIRKERDEGRTVLLSSHLVGEVEELADNVVYLLDGEPFFQGTLEEIRARSGESRLERAIVQMMESSGESNS